MKDYIGEPEDSARLLADAEGYDVRITARDGEYYFVTADLQRDRINFRIEDGMVVFAEIG